ncbi:hypothetical protein Y032_0105g3715 [Ancylostoma ceylanicum]|uniref:Peptidase M13 N-terminal domain-containing protein n=2 Tax=Ancylostoma ceylanicum TaxID=53326 RepID=A0A016TGF7_9BILA|nr:hypothetical protein Y032_0105g3715 [Ancylostoma ceylanicum]
MFATKFSIDWSDYLRTVTPTSTHKYTLADPVVFVQKIEYLKRMNELLAKTPDRTLINYVVIQYLKSWLPVLSKPHTDVIDEFLAKSQHYVPTRADRCVAFVKSKMPVAVGAMFARATSSEKIKPAASEILNETVEAFKSTIESNTWMDKQTKKAIMSKVNRMERRVSHSEILMSNRKLDDYYFHKNLMLSADLPFPNLVDEIDRINSVNAYKSLRGDANRSDVCTNPFDISVHYDFNINRIVIPSAALHPPFFGLNYPRAYNYGAIGYIIAREMLRGFDHKGKDFDAEGNYVQWLPDNKVQTINKRVSCLSELFGKADGNGKDDEKSLENIATSEGLKLAFKALSVPGNVPKHVSPTTTAETYLILGDCEVARLVKQTVVSYGQARNSRGHQILSSGGKNRDEKQISPEYLLGESSLSFS